METTKGKQNRIQDKHFKHELTIQQNEKKMN